MRSLTHFHSLLVVLAAIALALLGSSRAAAQDDGKSVAGTTSARFAVTPDGTSSYSIPLAVPPGTAGVEPKLSLVYSSRGGVSPYGFGWSLSGLSQIQRGPRNLADDGIVAGVKLSANDAFYLDGEKLVEVESSAAGCKEYRTRTDTFVRVRSYGGDASGPAYFVVETRAGLTMTYGKAPEARVALTDGRATAWLVERIEDRSGNYMIFRYKFDDDGGKRGLDFVLERVDYSGNERQGLAPYASIVFDYSRLAPDKLYGERYVLGQRTKLGWRLGSVVSSYRGQVLRRYVPAYRPANDSDRFETLDSLTEEGADGLHYRPLEFKYPSSRPGWEPSDIMASIRDLPGLSDVIAAVPRSYRFVQLPNGGTNVPAVLVSAEAGGKRVQAAYLRDTATGQWKEDKNFTPPVLFAGTDGEADDVVIVDIDGDGDDDIISSGRLGDNAAATWEATTAGWKKGAALPVRLTGGTLAASGILDLDVFDSAGQRSLAFAWNHIEPRTGQRLRDTRRWDGNNHNWIAIQGYVAPLAFSGSRAPAIAGVRAIDVDADGVRELVYYLAEGGAGQRDVYRARNGRWERFNIPGPYLLPVPELPSEAGLKLADVNGDGFVDLVWAFDSASGRETGVGLARPGGWIAESRDFHDVAFWRSGDNPVSGVSGDIFDINGDALPDLVEERSGERAAWRGDGTQWLRDDKLDPKTTLGSTAAERSVAFRILKLPGSNAWTWIGLRPGGGMLAPESYRFDAATGWQLDQALKVPVDLAQFDKVDLGIRFLDLTNDGLPDIVWARRRNDGDLDRAVYLFNPDATEPWRKDVRYLLPAPIVREDYLAAGTVIADINGDGRADLIEARRTTENGRVIEKREAWINCAALPECANVPADRDSGYWLAVSTTAKWRGLAPPTVFVEDGVGALGAQTLDVDGDGLADIVTARDVEVWLDEDGKVVPPNTADAKPAYRLEAKTWLNDKGLGWRESDAFRLPVALARPVVRSNFGAGPSDEPPFAGTSVIDTRVQLIDLDGDRLPEVTWSFEATRQVKSGTGPVMTEKVTMRGARFGSGNGWQTDAPGYLPPVRLDDDPAAPSRQSQMEDINGDGSIDLLLADGANSQTYLNTGIGWSEAATFRIPEKAIRSGKGDQGFRILDLNGDMLPDIAYKWTTAGGSEQGAFINTGIGWAAIPAFAPTIAFAEHDRGDVGVRPLDINGDGLLDLVQSYKRSDSDTNRQVQVNRSDRPYLLISLTNGLGAATTVRYRSFLTLDRPTGQLADRLASPEPAVRLAPGTGQPSAYPIIHAPLPGFLVAQVTEQGPGVLPRRLRYAYDGNRVDIRSGRSLGFETTEVFDVERGRKTVTTFSQEDAKLGSPIKAEVWQGTQLISRTASDWRVDERAGLTGSTGLAGFTPKIVRRNLERSASSSWGLDGTLMSGEDTQFIYDINGNTQRVAVAYADSSTSITENTFRDDPANWSLGRLIEATVTLTSPDVAAPQVRSAKFGYEATNGLIEWESALVGTQLETMTSFRRDRFGNKVSITLARPDGSKARTETITFDTEGRFPTSATNALGHRSQMTTDPISGATLTRSDPNGLTLRTRYDSLQRPLGELSPSGVETVVTAEFSSLPGTSIVISRRTPGMALTRTWSDSAGRPVRTEQAGWGGRTVISEMRYDVLGRTTETVLPHFDGERALSTTSSYDALDRPQWAKRADGAVTKIEYRGLEQTTIQPDGTRALARLDLRGRTRESVDPAGGVTRFRFDAGGRTSATETAAGVTITQEYDVAGNRIFMNDPTSGRWTYTYDIFGKLIGQMDPRGETARLEYDALGRLTAKHTREGSTSWTYDVGDHAIGRLVAVTTGPKDQSAMRYDALGRPYWTERTIGRDILTSTSRFDVLGRVVERKFSTGVVLHNSFDIRGQLVGVSLLDGEIRRQVYRLLNVDAAGRVTSSSMGNGIVTRTRYDAETGRFVGVTSRTSQGIAQDLKLEYDLVGNVTTMSDTATGEAGSFGYDQLRRLTHVEQSGQAAIDVAYDVIGNITAKTNAGVYSYCDRGNLKGLLCGVTGANGTMTLDYDAAGNVTRLGERALTFDSTGRVSEITGTNGTRSRFSYDVDGNLSFQSSVYGPKQHRYSTSYFGGVQLIRENYAPPGIPTPERTTVRHALSSEEGVFGYYDKVYRHYPYRFAAPIYGRVMTEKPERVTDLRYGFSYLLKDHLGSVRAVLNEDGKVLDRFRYDPWGKRIEVEGYRYRHVKDGFTGHEMLDNLDLVHMGGRVYDPLLGRFLSADPQVQSPLYSQSYNRYSYVLNNPLTLVDPTGFGWFDDVVGGFFRGVGNAFTTVLDAVVGKPLSWVGEQLAKGGRWLQQNWQTVAIIAIACVMPAATVWYAAVLQGAAMGALSAALYGGGPDEILRGALIGGATAGAFHGVGSAGIENQALASGAHGVVGGVSSVAQGGTFESGFLSAAVTKATSNLPSINNQAYQVASAAVIGGVTSQISGGSFENGAVTGAFSRLFNDCAHGNLCSAPDEGPSRLDKFVANLPDIPPGFSNAVQGFGAGLTLGGTDWVNEQLGAGGYVDRSSLAYQGGKIVGNVVLFELGGAAVSAGGKAMATRMASSETFGLQSTRFSNGKFGVPRGTWNRTDVRLGWSYKAADKMIYFQPRIYNYHVPSPLRFPAPPLP